MPVLPFWNNIGPGNDPLSPRNIFDWYALEHDIAYDDAKTREDIVTADERFLKQYYGTVAKSIIELFHKAAGISGIELKRAFEKYIIPIYPRGLPMEGSKKRKLEGGEGGEMSPWISQLS